MATKKARSSAQTASKASTSKKKTTRKKATKSTSRKKSSTKKVGGRASRAASSTSATEAPFQATTVSRESGGRTLTLESGRMAKQADGSILASYGETVVLATAQSAKARDDIDFLPLTCEYREKASAAGKFPGGFFKREGRPTTREILTCRIIDRSVRPLFPDGFRREVQVLAQVMSTDQENESDIVAAIDSSANKAKSFVAVSS